MEVVEEGPEDLSNFIQSAVLARPHVFVGEDPVAQISAFGDGFLEAGKSGSRCVMGRVVMDRDEVFEVRKVLREVGMLVWQVIEDEILEVPRYDERDGDLFLLDGSKIWAMDLTADAAG